MIKRLFLLNLILLFSVSIKASVGDWTLYPSYNNATHCEISGDKVYILASGALFSFNTSDNEVLMYDKLNSLSDIDITHIAYSEHIKALLIVYSNANIDILYDDETIYNITDFKNSSASNKKVNSVYLDKEKAYLSTEFGVVVLDLERLEIKNSYNTGLNTLCTLIFKDKIYTGTTEGLFRCDTTKNMLDFNNWEKLNYYRTDALCEFNGELYFMINYLGVYTLDTEINRFQRIVEKNGAEYYTIYNSGNEILALANDKMTIINKDKNYSTYKTENSRYILKKGDWFWNCKGYDGLYMCRIENNILKEVSSPLVPNSPVRNFCEFMKFTSDNKLLIAGGNLNYYDITFHEGTLMEYDTESGKWLNFPEKGIKESTKVNYMNICSADEDPTEPGHYFAASFGYGLYEFRNGEFVKHYNHLNSPLESAIKEGPMERYVRVSHVEFDKDGNLWCINTDSKDIIKILKKNGEWTTVEYKDIEKMPTMVKPLVDSRGWLWITSLQSKAGLFCAKTKGTPYDTSDDDTGMWLGRFMNQDGIGYDIYQLYALCEDKKGDMWVGTNAGIFVIDNPESFFNNGIFKQIKVPRNDGTGLADYLMNGVYIKAIETDEANRKWIGTLDNGVYLISEDGLEIIHHFTEENSPLPSNFIESIAVNDITGEVFFGTDKGLASYKGDATRPQDKLNEKKIHAYPNPVSSNYSGNISIVGLTEECNVKIVDGSGYLINEGTSNGGMYTWNGRNMRGEKVASGVYHVLLYDKDGNEGETTRIVITK
jgi:hypothetical protein